MLTELRPLKANYRLWLEDRRIYNSTHPLAISNPSLRATIPTHLRQVYTPYRHIYDLLNSERQLFVNDTLPKTSMGGIYIGYLNVEYDLEVICGCSISSTDYYGVCDNASQVMEFLKANSLLDNADKYIVLMTPIIKEHEPPQGGWRWHKWGQYIGKYEPCHEYIHDEPDIEMVFVFQVMEISRKSA